MTACLACAHTLAVGGAALAHATKEREPGVSLACLDARYAVRAATRAGGTSW